MDEKKTISPSVIMKMLVFVVAAPLLPILVSFRWNWWEAWLYAFVCIAGFAASRLMAGSRNPDLIAERARFLRYEDAFAWDKLLAPLVGLGGGLVPLVIGLEARFDTSPAFNTAFKLFALAAILAGYALGSYALVENKFFSGMVRIQKDRGHTVVSSGPYAHIRHPGYAGALLSYAGTPLFLDSLWGYVPVLVLAVLLVIRTRLEDKALRENLAGYTEYAQRVRYRLIPGIW